MEQHIGNQEFPSEMPMINQLPFQPLTCTYQFRYII